MKSTEQWKASGTGKAAGPAWEARGWGELLAQLFPVQRPHADTLKADMAGALAPRNPANRTDQGASITHAAEEQRAATHQSC